MKTAGLLLLGLSSVAGATLWACEDKDEPGTVDGGVIATIDAAPGSPDAMIPVDAGPPPADAMPTHDADTEGLADLVDAIVDDLNEVYDTICDCDDLFCVDAGDPYQITPAQRDCMVAAVLAKAGTPGLEKDLTCAADSIHGSLVCVTQAGCGADPEDPAFGVCFDDEPACLDSPLFANDFENCIDGP